MVAAPLLVIFLIAVFVAIKWVGMSPAAIILGALTGLALGATTAIGGPILSGIESASTSAIVTFTNAVGGIR